jgi:hypothetical protein
MIASNKALKEMEAVDGRNKRIPFQVTFVTADRDQWRRRQKLMLKLQSLNPESDEAKELKEFISKIDIGGKIITHDKCVLSGTRGMHATRSKNVMNSNPSHWKNKTRNIKFLPSCEIRKIHVRLITEFNRQETIY